MNIQQAIAALLKGESLSGDDMQAVMRQIMTGEASPAQIGGFLIGLRIKGESVEEITAAAQVMRGLAERVALDEDALDIVGTGGDASGSFNVSTASAIVAAAAGATVAKHGNRSVSSRSGAADLLERAGVHIELDADAVSACIARAGIGFMFAPRHHSAMKYAVGPRREMGVRTVFNVLGPLTNPAFARRQLIGVFAADLVEPIAEAFGRLGSLHAMVVHGEAGLDEIDISGPTRVAEVRAGALSHYAIEPEQFGFERAPLSAIEVADAAESLSVIEAVFAGESGPARDTVLLNAGAGVYVAGRANNLAAGIERARVAIDTGDAAEKLAEFVRVSQQLGGGG